LFRSWVFNLNIKFIFLIRSAPKLKLLIFVPTLECGGLERNVAIICNNMDTTKYDVTLVVLNNSKQFFPITNVDVRVLDLQIANVRKSLFSILKISREMKPDIILTTANHLNLLFGIFKWMFPKRIKILARESSIVSINTQRTWNPAIYHWLLRVFYKNIDLIVCQSKYMQDDLIANYHIQISNTRIIHNAVNPPELIPVVNPSENITKLITVARLSKEKGLDRLIRAVSYLTIPYRFTIIGEGDMRSELEKLIKDMSLQDKVILAGGQDKPFSQVSSPDLFLMGSYYEGFPNAMLEAIAASIPVVAFNAPGGIAELIVNGRDGILVEGNDEKEFSLAIKKAIEIKFDKKQIMESAIKRFNVEAIMGQWYQLFESVK